MGSQSGLLGKDLRIDPARRPINGDKQVLVLRIIRHLRGIFHTYVQVPGIIGFARIERTLRLRLSRNS